MTEAATSSSSVGQVSVLITNGARFHEPLAWARTTADQLVSIGPELEGHRLMQALGLRNNIASALREAFEECRVEDPAKLAQSALTRIVDLACGSPWELFFSHPEVRASMAEVIDRNIRTAAIDRER